MNDCPTGKMDRAKIESMYAMVLPPDNAKSFVDQIFKIFDEDGDGTIDFKVSMDLFSSLTICSIAGVHDRHRCDSWRIRRGQATLGIQNV